MSTPKQAKFTLKKAKLSALTRPRKLKNRALMLFILCLRARKSKCSQTVWFTLRTTLILTCPTSELPKKCVTACFPKFSAARKPKKKLKKKSKSELMSLFPSTSFLTIFWRRLTITTTFHTVWAQPTTSTISETEE